MIVLYLCGRFSWWIVRLSGPSWNKEFSQIASRCPELPPPTLCFFRSGLACSHLALPNQTEICLLKHFANILPGFHNSCTKPKRQFLLKDVKKKKQDISLRSTQPYLWGNPVLVISPPFEGDHICRFQYYCCKPPWDDNECETDGHNRKTIKKHFHEVFWPPLCFLFVFICV